MSETNPPSDPTNPPSPASSNDPVPAPEPKRRKRRKWPWIVGGMLLLLILLVLLAPTIASTGPVRSIVISKVNENLNGKMAVKDWSIGWTSGVTINEVKVDDAQGARVLEVASVRVPVSLLDAIRGNIDLGDTVIDKPNLVNVRVYADGTTNLDKLAKSDGKTETKPDEPAGRLPDVKGKVTINEARGTINVEPKPGEKAIPPIFIDPSTVTVNIPGINQPIENSAKLVYRVGQAEPSTIEVNGTVDAIENNQVAVNQLKADQKLKITRADVSAAAAFMQKEGETVTLTGVSNGDLSIKADGLNAAAVDGTLTVSDFTFGGTPLKGDTYKTSKINVPIKVTTSAQGADTLVKIETLRVETDHATVDVSGQATQQALTNLSEQKAPGSAGGFAVVVKTTDLAGLVNSLRNTIGLQPEVSMTDGAIGVRVDLALDKDSATVKQTLDAQAKGTNAGKPVQLETVHLETSLSALETGGKLQDLREIALKLTSAFANVEGGGASIANVNLGGKLDLAKARQQAGQFVDLGNLDFAGAGDFSVTSKGDLTQSGGTADVNAKLNFANLVVRGLEGKADVNQPRIAIDTDATLIRGPEGGEFVQGIDKAKVSVQAGDAAAPVIDLLVTATKVTLGKIGVESFEVQKLSVPDLARVQQQFGAFLPPDLVLAGGSVTANVKGSYKDDVVTFDKKAQLTNVTIQSIDPATKKPSPLITNETDTIAAAGMLAMPPEQTMTATLNQLAIASSTGLFTLQKGGQGPLVVQVAPNGAIGGNGQLTIGSDLKRVNDVLQAMGGQPAVTTSAGQLTSGKFDATLNLASAADKGTDIGLDGAITNLSVTTNAEPIQNEKVAITVKASTPADLSVVTVANALIDSSFAKTQVTETQLVLGGGVFDMLKKAKVRIDIPDLAKTYAVASAFTPPATQPVEPTTQPVEPLNLKGSAIVSLDVSREGNVTRVTAPEIAASNLAISRGKRAYSFEKAIALKLAADLGTKKVPTAASTQPVAQVDEVKITQLAGDLGGVATLAAPGAIVLSALTTDAPTANGKIGVSGTLDKLVQVLSVVLDAEPMPYRGSYEVAQTVATQSGQLTLAGNATVNDLQVLGADGKPQFTEKQLVVANDLTADPATKVATIKNVELSMPESKAAGVKLTGAVKDWEVKRELDAVKLALVYDLQKLWPMIKPLLDPQMQETYKDLKIAGQFERTFDISGSYPAKDAAGKELAFNQSVRTMKVYGGLGVGLLDTSGITLQNLELPVSLSDGQLVTLYLNKPKEQRGAKPATLNGGTLDLNSIVVDLTEEIPRLSIGKNQQLVANASFNPLLGDSLGKFINPIFANATRAQGLIDLTVVSCDKLALGEAMKGPQSGSASFVFNLREMDIANPLGNILFGESLRKIPSLSKQAADTEAFRGQIQNAQVSINNGVISENITFELGKKPPEGTIAAAPKASQLYPMTFKGTVAMADLRQNLAVMLPSALFNSKEVEQYLPNGVPVTLKGLTTKPEPDFGNFAKILIEEVTKSQVGGLLGGDKKDGKSNSTGDLLEGVLGGNKRQQQQQQPPQKQGSTTKPAQPAEPDIGGVLNDIFGGKKKK